MTDYTYWPENRTGRRRRAQCIALPAGWMIQWRRDIRLIKATIPAENESHAIILAVREMAKRIEETQ